jgi:hypothetical protein
MSWAAAANAGTDIGTENPCGLGAVIGQPTGISGKCYIGGRRFGWDALVAYEFYQQSAGILYAHSTAQWHPSELVEEEWGNISWYFGAGPFVGFWTVNAPAGFSDSGVLVGIRSPIGLSFDLAELPLQIITEIALSAGLYPATRIGMGGGLGVRYYF